jgi:hypothetical protein
VRVEFDQRGCDDPPRVSSARRWGRQNRDRP